MKVLNTKEPGGTLFVLFCFQAQADQAETTSKSATRPVSSILRNDSLDQLASSSTWNGLPRIAVINITSNEQTLITGSMTGKVYLHEIHNKLMTSEFSISDGMIISLSSTDEHFALSDKLGHVEVYHLQTLSKVHSYSHGNSVGVRQILLTDKLLVSVGDDKLVKIFHIDDWHQVGQISRKDYSRKQCITIQENILTMADKDVILQFKITSRGPRELTRMDIPGHHAKCILCIYRNEETLYLIGTNTGLLMLTNLKRVIKVMTVPSYYTSIIQLERLQEWIVIRIRRFGFSLLAISLESGIEEDMEPEFKQIVGFRSITSNFVAKGENIFYFLGEELTLIDCKKIEETPTW